MSKAETVQEQEIFLVDALKLVLTCLIYLLAGKLKDDEKPKEKTLGADDRY